MKGYNFMLALVFSLFLVSIAGAQYWFQTGVRSSNGAAFNYGASVSIQTIYQNISEGSLGYWVGEDLSNGAFLQIGYEIANSSGDYPSYCSPTAGCSNYTFIKAGVPTYFWEYFPAGYSGSQFYGGLGQNGSAGANGTFNTYSFRSESNTWYFYVNGKLVGSAYLGASSSGANPPVAFGEVAGTETNSSPMQIVRFRNLEYYDGSTYKLVPKGYSYIGYGKGSLTSLANPYGISEVGSFVDYFEVGSGLPLQNHTELWQLGYSLNVISEYANISYSGNYSAYSTVYIEAPAYVYLGSGKRAAFIRWIGSGIGSYSGSSLNASVEMDSNITEQAVWQVQYLLNTSNTYGLVNGSGWYPANSTVHLSVESTSINVGVGKRIEFLGWSNGEKNPAISIIMGGPLSISPIWALQYLVNASTQYGNLTGVGWYNANSTASIYEGATLVSRGANTYGFYSWSNGSTENPLVFKVTHPVLLSAIYVPVYRENLEAFGSDGQQLQNVSYVIDGKGVNSSVLFFSGKTYTINDAKYNGVQIALNEPIKVNESGSIKLVLPVYNVAVYTKSVLGAPVNATLDITFLNGTSILLHTGANGYALLKNVPYGSFNATASFFGPQIRISAKGSKTAQITMLSPWTLAMVIFAAITSFLFERIVYGIKVRRKAQRD
ncbi:MAG: hypothetical protein ACP5RM_01320 [Candidatus Micrarchaeia archaeon]